MQAVRQWLAQRDLVIVLSLFVATLLVFGFLQIADAVGPGGSPLEQSFLLALREPGAPRDPLGPAWFEGMWLNLTALGSGDVVTLLTLIVLGYLAMLREWRTAIVFAVAVVGAALGGTLLKEVFDRPRPDFVHRMIDTSSLSFPSGHSLMSAVVYPTLGAMLARLVRHRGLKIYVVCVALLLMVLVGFSRVYLGVHYPSDVLAGWMLGLGWAIVCWTVLRALQRRRVVEPPGMPVDADDSEPARGSDSRAVTAG